MLPRTASVSRLLPISLVALAASARADVLVVGPFGSGADYDQIAAAIADAQPGDQIRILAGTYSGFDLDKPLQIIGEDRDQVLLLTTNPFAPAMRVRDIADGESVHLSGFTAESVIGFGNLSVENCVGAVTLDDLRIGDKLEGQASLPALIVQNCKLVLVTNSVFEVTDSQPAVSTTILGAPAAVRVTDSTAIFEGCELRGADVGLDGLTLFYKDTWGGGGLLGERSEIVLSDCLVEAGVGGKSTNATITGRGGTAVELNGGALVVTGDSVLLGNDAPAGTGVVTAAGGPAIAAFASAKLLVDPSTTLAGGFGMEPPVQAPATVLGPLAVQVPVLDRFLTLHADNVPGQANFRVDLEVRAKPLQLVLPFVAIGASGPWTVPGLDGLSVIDPSNAIALPPLTTDNSESIFLELGTAPVPGLAGMPAVFHGYLLDIATGIGALGFGTATTLRL